MKDLDIDSTLVLKIQVKNLKKRIERYGDFFVGQLRHHSSENLKKRIESKLIGDQHERGQALLERISKRGLKEARRQARRKPGEAGESQKED